MRNRHDDTCYVCFSQVKAGHGYLSRKPGGWAVRHTTCSPEVAGPSAMFYVDNKDFTASLLVRDGKVIETAPMLKYMQGWSLQRVDDYCEIKGWEVRSVEQKETPA